MFDIWLVVDWDPSLIQSFSRTAIIMDLRQQVMTCVMWPDITLALLNSLRCASTQCSVSSRLYVLMYVSRGQ